MPTDSRVGVNPILVSWPNFFIAIAQDFGSEGFTCPAPPSASGENQAYCIAADFMDLPQQYADQTLVNTLKPGLELFKFLVTGPVPPAARSAAGRYAVSHRRTMAPFHPSPGSGTRCREAATAIC